MFSPLNPSVRDVVTNFFPPTLNVTIAPGACNILLIFFFVLMETPLSWFESQPGSHKVLVEVCEARNFVGDAGVSYDAFNAWCVRAGMSFSDSVLATCPGLFVAQIGLMKRKKFGRKKQCLSASRSWSKKVKDHNGLRASHLLAWFLDEQEAGIELKSDFSHPFHPLCFLVALVECGFEVADNFQVYQHGRNVEVADSRLARFERELDSRRRLDDVCLARAKVLATRTSQEEFAKWCISEKLSINMMKMKGLFATAHQVVHCRPVGRGKLKVNAVSMLMKKVEASEGLYASQLLGWFLLAKEEKFKKLNKEVSEPNHVMLFLVLLVESGFIISEDFRVYSPQTVSVAESWMDVDPSQIALDVSMEIFE